MNKKIWIIIAIIIIIGLGIFFFFNNTSKENETNTNENTNYEAQRSSVVENNINTSSNKTQNTDNNQTENTVAQNDTNVQEITKNSTSTQINMEEEIASFSTKIYSKNDDKRQNNLSITCSTLNDTIVAPGETFSFCDTVGKATKSKGYEEADIFTSDGEKTKGLGGGNCQISSTLYNAVLEVKDLEVIERHEHSGKVYYVPEGKDAAVAYGSYDFKFKNNTNKSIKIKAENTENEVIIKLLSV